MLLVVAVSLLLSTQLVIVTSLITFFVATIFFYCLSQIIDVPTNNYKKYKLW
jgi:hypothetical protein